MKNKIGFLILGTLAILVIAVLAFWLFISSGIGFLGWLLMILALIIFGFLIYRMHSKGLVMIGYISLGLLISILAIFIFTGGLGAGGKSSVVSEGVDKKDLGNIINGQYYFDDGNTVYYSNFDDDYTAHIYEMNEKSGANKPIFDGFGWSLVTYKGHLYFSGNTGDIIDGTYRLFKLNLKDYSYEVINEDYCYGMSLYKNWLYFINRDSSGKFSYKRYNTKDGTMETVIEDGRGKIVVIYDKSLYFLSGEGYIGKADPDGSNIETLVYESAEYFIIGNGKIVYSSDGVLKTCSITGEDVEVIREYGGNDIVTINSNGNTIFFTEYNTSVTGTAGGYPYNLRAIKFNGKGEEVIYRGESWGFYINSIGNRVYALDYLNDTAAGHPTYVTIISTMDKDGSDLKLLPN